VREVREAYDFTDLQSFLDFYYEGTQVRLYERDFYELTFAYLQKAASQGVRHAEIFFDPQAHTIGGVDPGTVITGLRRALEDGERRLGMSSHLIMRFLRHLSADEAMETLHQVLPYREWIVGVGLDSSEVGHPPEAFEEAGRLGFRRVAHAGGRRATRVHQAGAGRTGGSPDRPRRQVRGGPWASTEARGGTGTAYRLPALQREAARLSRSRGAPRKADATRGVVRDGALR
jgi:adenosine deaminase